MTQRCRYCHCTDEDGCPAGCSWAAEDVCSMCADFIHELDAYVDACRRVSISSLARMLREIDDAFLSSRPQLTAAGRKYLAPATPKAKKARARK